jgi:diguanylate cyclase (GGDEF)-like protein
MLQNMHNQLTFQATHDELTGLINRKEFEHQVSRTFVLAKGKKMHHVVAFLDLDQFQSVNDRGGHEAGDKMLIDLSEEIENIIPQGTILSRLGGDEFGLLLQDCDREDGMAIIQNVCAAIKDFYFEWGRDIFSLTVSCGVVNVDEETESVAYIISGVDSACRKAKDTGRDRIEVYETDDSQLAHRKNIMDFVSQIDQSLAEDRFILNCQLIKPIDEDSEELPQYEILLTILDGNDEPMPPLDFIIAAETNHRMGEIDRWVIRNAFKFIATNILRLDHLGAFTINISGNSLIEDDFMEFVLEQFNETRLPASKICFEITEKAAFGNLDSVIDFIEKMQIIGVQFSLDDFGRDLSSYSYLRRLPVDYLKIDGSFVKDIKTNPSDYAVVKSINEIGHFMGKTTIAEFVEDDEVVEILREIGVDFVQGFGIGKKVPITELLK